MQTLLPSNPTANYIPMRNTHTHQKTRTRTFPAALFETALKWKLSKCPLALERENEMWYIYKVEHQTATRMNGLVTRAYSVHKTWSVHLRLCAFFVCMLPLQYGVSKRNGKRSCSRNSCPRNVLGHETEALPHPVPRHPQAGWGQRPGEPVTFSGSLPLLERKGLLSLEYNLPQKRGCRGMNVQCTKALAGNSWTYTDRTQVEHCLNSI